MSRCGVWCTGGAETERSPGHRAKPEAPDQRSEGSAESNVLGDRMKYGLRACGSRDRVAELAAAAWHEPAARAAMAWTLLCELAIARGESVDRTGVALESIDARGVLTATERAGLDGGASIVDVLHAWGRGRFDRSPDAGTLATRLADLVALRVLVRLAAGEAASRAIAEARWYALLPAKRRKALLAAVAQRTALLRVLVEAHHA
jgi:hypothetical protein